MSGFQSGGSYPQGTPGLGYGPMVGGHMADPSLIGGPVAGGPSGPIPSFYSGEAPPLRPRSQLTPGRVFIISLATSIAVCSVFFALWIALGARLMPMALVLPAETAKAYEVIDGPGRGRALARPAPEAAAAAAVPATPVEFVAPAVPAAAVAVPAAAAPAVGAVPAAAAPAEGALLAKVPAVIRQSLRTAEAAVRRAGFRPEARFQPYNEDVSPMQVVGQFPLAGSPLEPGRVVVLTVNPEE